MSDLLKGKGWTSTPSRWLKTFENSDMVVGFNLK